jgi:hypothetical protein
VKSEEGPGWTILRDDFMMGASVKDWDKESDGPEAADQDLQVTLMHRAK